MKELKRVLNRFVIPLTLIGLMCLTGCAGLAHRGDPLEGWKMCWSQDPQKLDKQIRDDYQSYIDRLPHRQRKYVVGIDLFEDGKGQHAVKIEIPLNGAWLEHLLIYNSQNQRVRAITYKHGHYAS